MCKFLIKFLAFFLRKLEARVNTKLMKKLESLNSETNFSTTNQKFDFIGTIILLVTSTMLMASSYFLTSFILTLTHT